MSTRTYEPITARDVAFLGLGVMGHPMAGHLARAGHRTTVYNRTAAKAAHWAAEHGGRHAPTPREAAKGADIVFACVGNDADLRAITLGEQGAFGGMAPGAVFVARADGSSAREIWRGEAGIPWLRWSPDGRRLRFGSFDRAGSEWWWLDLPSDGSSPPKRVGRGERGAWSADGERFVFGQWGTPGGTAGVVGPRFNLYAAPAGEVWSPADSTPLTFGPFDFASDSLAHAGRTLLGARSSHPAFFSMGPSGTR